MTYTSDNDLPLVTDQMLLDALLKTRPYTAAVLRPGPRFEPLGPDRSPEVAAVILEHGKRNHALRLAGLLRIVCPVADGSNVVGISVFDATPEDVDRILAGDPAVKANILTYEIHPTRTFPDSTLMPSETAATHT